MERLGYAGIFLIVLIENLFPPIPSEFVLPFSGFMTTQGIVSIPGVIVAATLGSVVGAIVLYWAGALIGRDRVYRIVERYQRLLTVKPEHLQKAEDWFHRYGTRTILFCRVLPIVRSIISIPGGLMRMNLIQFALYTSIGALAWNTALVGMGALLGHSWPTVVTWMEYYKLAFLAVGATLALVVGIVYWRKRRVS